MDQNRYCRCGIKWKKKGLIAEHPLQEYDFVGTCRTCKKIYVLIYTHPIQQEGSISNTIMKGVTAMKQYIFGNVVVLVGILALLWVGCDKSRNIPDSPIQAQVKNYSDLPGRMSDREWSEVKKEASLVQELPTSTVYYFPDESIVTEKSYASLPTSEAMKEKMPSQAHRGDCSGSTTTVAIKCRNKDTLVITGVPTCVWMEFDPSSQCVTFNGSQCGCESKQACCGSR